MCFVVKSHSLKMAIIIFRVLLGDFFFLPLFVSPRSCMRITGLNIDWDVYRDTRIFRPISPGLCMQ